MSKTEDVAPTDNSPADHSFPNAMLSARRPTGPILAVVVVAVFFIIGQIPALVLLGGDGEGSKTTFATQMILTMSFLASTLLLMAWVVFKERRSFRSVGFTGAAMRPIVRGGAIGLAMTLTIVLVAIISGQAHLSAPQWSALVPALILLVGFTVQASTEEIFDRGYLLQATAWRWGISAAIVLQTLVFGAMHAANGNLSPVAIINILLVAVMLAYWALAEGALWGVCAFHTLWNWSQGNLWGASVSNVRPDVALLRFEPVDGANDLITGGKFGLEGSLVATALLGITAIIAALRYRAKSRR